MTRVPTEFPTIFLKPISCPLCGHEESARLLVAPDWYCGLSGDDDFAIAGCRSCRHVFMNPAPTMESIPACYPGGYAPHKSEAASLAALSSDDRSTPAVEASAESKPPLNQNRNSPWYLSPFVRGIPGLRWLYYWLTETKSQPVPPIMEERNRALEIGCGSGKYLLKLRESGWNAEGVDLVEAAVTASREKGFAVHHGDLASFPAQPESYDGVFAWMVLEHLPHPRETLLKLHHLLKPNGCLGCSVPNFGSWERKLFGRYWMALELPRHLQHYTLTSLTQLLRETGFTDIEVIYQPTLFTALGSIGYWLRDRFPRSQWGPRLVNWFFQNPPLVVTLLIAPWGRLLAAVRQSGCITVFARRA